MQVVQAFGDGEGFWSGLYNFFDDNPFGEALLKVGTGAGSTALNTFIQGQLGPPRLQSGQILYSPYNTLPAATTTPAATTSAAMAAATGPGVAGGFEQIVKSDYTPWILAGAGALLLLAVLS